MINLELYKIFVLVADEKNITKASEILHISQPAVTKHIQNLEDELQIKLFYRTSHGVELTEEGETVYQEVKEPVSILDNIYHKYGKIRSINLGIHGTMLNELFSQKLTEYYETYENVNIHISNFDTLEMLSKLEKQELDIVISKKTEKYNKEKLEFMKLGSLHDILVVNCASDLLRKGRISEKELKRQILYMPRRTSVTTTNFFHSLQCGERDFRNIKNISYHTMLEIIKNTNSVGLVTKEYVQRELRERKIVELKTKFMIEPVKFGIYINKNNQFKELKNLIKIIQKYAVI